MILRKRPVAILATSLSIGLLPLLYTTASYAIVIQPVQVKSALGEPFYAEIAISDLGNLNLKDVSVDIANPQLLADFGVPSGSYNQPLSISVQAQSTDRGVIVIRGRQPVNDPFVEFVLQVKTGQNTRLQRVNAMIDPQSNKKKNITLTPTTPAAVPSVNLPVSSTPTITASVSETQASRSEQRLNVAKTAPPDMQASTSSVNSLNQTENSSKKEPQSSAVRPIAIANDKPKHVVKKNESLWKIAKQLEPQLKQPVGQIMQRIRDLNQDAFISGNPDQLRRGAMLVLPENEQKTALVVAKTPAKSPSKPMTKPDTSAAPSQLAKSIVLPKAELTLIAPTTQGNAQGTGNTGKNSESPSLPREIVLKIGQERRKTVLLQHEVSELDAQLTLNDKKIAMLNAKLAELEHQLKTRNQAQKPVVQPQQMKKPPSKTMVPKVAANAFLPIIATAGFLLLASSPNSAYAAEGDSGGFPLWIIGVVALIIIAVVAKVITGKNNDKKPVRPKSKRPAVKNEQLAKSAAPAPAQPVPVARPVAQPQADVLQEVQSYIERERYSQAQGLLKDAIGKNPKRADLHVKLLEVYALQNDIKGFESEFSIVEAFNQPELSEHAQKMRVLLHPVAEETLEDLSLEFTPSNLPKVEPASSEVDFQSPTPSADTDSGLDFPSTTDQSLAELEAEFGFSPESSPAARSETHLDFDLSQHQTTTQVQPQGNQVDFTPSSHTDQVTDEPMLDLDFDLKDAFTLEEVKVPTQAPTTFELEQSHDQSAVVPAKSSVNLDQLTVEDTNWAADFADQDFNLSTDTTSTQSASVAVAPTVPADLANNPEDFLSKEFPFLVNLDVQQTNLELAESYINLGERSSARELLGEVITQGNTQQKAQAQHLMQKLVS